MQLYKCSFSNARRKLTYFSKLILLLTSSRNYSNNIHEWTQLQHYFGFVCLILFCFVLGFLQSKKLQLLSASVKSQTFISGRFSNLSTRTKRAKFSCPGRLYIHLFTYNGFQHISALVYLMNQHYSSFLVRILKVELKNAQSLVHKLWPLMTPKMIP